jgi:halocyanin-like protein
MSTNDMSRRGFLTAAAGTAAAGAAAGTATAQQEAPDYGAYLNNANLYSEGEFADHRGEDSLTISVGAGEGFAFDPPTIWIDPGTTVTWEWTGEGGGHNVVTEEGPAGFNQPDVVSEAGYTYEYEFTEEDAGITTYKCEPHEAQGMKGGIAVGGDVETIEVGGGGGGPPIQIPDNVYSLTMATFLALVTTLGLGYFFMKYGGDYEAE